MNSTVLKRNNPLQQNHSPHTLFQLPKSWIGYNGIISPRNAEANSVKSFGSSTYISFCSVFCEMQVNLINQVSSRLIYSLLLCAYSCQGTNTFKKSELINSYSFSACVLRSADCKWTCLISSFLGAAVNLTKTTKNSRTAPESHL